MELLEENKKLKEIIHMLRDDYYNYWLVVDNYYSPSYPCGGSDYEKTHNFIDMRISVLYHDSFNYEEFVNESLENAIEFLKNEIYI